MTNRLTVKDIRTKNKINVLTAIVNSNGITRNELAKRANVSLMTITNVVDELLDAGYIYETKTESSIGRTPTNLFIDDSLGIFVSVDLTSTKQNEYIMYDLKKKIIFSDTYTYDNSISYIDNINKLMSILKKALDKFNVNLLGIGLAVPGAYIPDKDIILTSLIKEHQNINLMKMFKKYFNINNIVIGHDVNMAARAEYNALKPDSSLFYIYIGEGVGGTYINSGDVLKGKDLIAGDLGQVEVIIDNQAKTIQEVISIPSITKSVKESIGEFSISEIIRKYLEDDKKIAEFMEKILDTISRQINNICWLYNPNYIIISSSDRQLSRIIIDYSTKILETKNNGFISTKLSSSTYNENSALIGLLSEGITNYIINCAEGV